VHSAILDWAGRENIDLLVLGSRENKNTMQKIVPGTNNIGSTSDIIKSRCKCPCLIVRPAVGSRSLQPGMLLVPGMLLRAAALPDGSSLMLGRPSSGGNSVDVEESLGL
jgi:Universal stress protein family